MGRRIALVVVVLFAAIVAALFSGLFGRVSGPMESSWAYEEGLTLVRSDRRVAELLGEPIEAERPDGKVRTSGETGDAELNIALRGPRGLGTLHVVARKRYEKWAFESAVVDDDDGLVRIDLLSGGAGR